MCVFSKIRCGRFLSVFIFAWLFLTMGDSLALTSAEEQRALDKNVEIQQRIDRETMGVDHKRGAEETRKIRETRDFEKGKEVGKEESKDKGHCAKIKQINLSGNKIYSEKKIRTRFVDKYVGECLAKDTIEKLQNEITNFYIKKGYILARVYFDFSKMNQNILDMSIYEGIVKSVELNDIREKKSKKKRSGGIIDGIKNYRNKSRKFMAFPFKKNKPFNLRDFEQGLDQINRLSSNDAKLDIQPADKDGYSDIIINNRKTRSTSVSLGIDNSGSESTGKRKKKLTVSQDDLLALNDNIYVSYTKDDEGDRHRRYNRSLYTSLSIPFGYWTAKAGLSKSKYLMTIQGNSEVFKSKGDTTTQTYDIGRIIYRNQKYKADLGGELSVKETNSYIEDVKSDTGSRRLSVGTLYSSNTLYTKSGTIFVKPSYVRGLDIFNAKSDPRSKSEINRGNPKAQYRAFKLYSYWNTLFNIPIPKTEDKKLPINYMLTLNLQHAYDTLYGSEQFSLGGQYSVRGFQESSISGDSGYNIRNDIKIKASDVFGKNKFFAKTTLGLFYDYGYVRNHALLNDYTDEGYMSGTGVSLSYAGNYLNWEIVYSHGLHSPNYLRTVNNITEDRETIYFDVSVRF